MMSFDYVVIGIISLLFFFGLWCGVVGEVIVLVVWVVGIFVVIEFGGQVGGIFFIGIVDLVLWMLVGCVLIFVGVLLVMLLVCWVVCSMVKVFGLSVLDCLLGMIFGLVCGVLVIMVLVGLGGMIVVLKQVWWQEVMFFLLLEIVVLVVR